MKALRERMERLLEPRAASAILFDALALQAKAQVPTNHSSLSRFLEDALHPAATRRLGPSSADELLRELRAVLAQAPRDPEDSSHTVRVPIVTGPVLVVCLSRHAKLATALRAALDGDRLGIRNVDRERELEHVLTTQPELVIIDATDPLVGDVELVADRLAALPVISIRLLWGHDQPYGFSLAKALRARAVPFTRMDRLEGTDPLLDIVRSRFH